MKVLLRTVTAVTVGIATLLLGQLALETVAWWLTGMTTTFDGPLPNAIKFGIAAAAALALALSIGLSPA
ncbi:MAG: hypothetical protein ACK4NZ_08690, partial [Tsuneonella sp.]